MSDTRGGSSSDAATEPKAMADTMLGTGATSGDPELLARGTRIGHFELEGLVGRGGMGVVYAARDTKLDRRVAIKLVLGAVAGSVGSERRTRLDREARALARLSHPNVVQVFEIGEHDGQLYIVMEYIDGNALGRHLESFDGRDRWRDVLVTMLAAGEGLVAAHEAGLVHRDFKPDNVLVEKSGRVRVMDFGVAHTAENAALSEMDIGTAPTATNLALTQTGALLGTPAYMSPEQFRGARVDARSDQFAFCVVLYEALFRRRPFAGATVAELLAKVLEGPEPSFEGVDAPPAAVVDALRRGLARSPEERFASMSELLAALRRGIVRPARRRGVIWAIGVVTVLAAIGIAASLRARGEAPDTDTTSVTSASPVSLPPRNAADGGDEALQTTIVGPGVIDRDEVRAVVKANVEDITHCYHAALEKDPEAFGRVLIETLIGAAGNVELAKVTESELADPFLGSCIASKMMGWRFPAPVGGTVTVYYPFNLEPG